jgi:hypothetical protein
MLDLEISLLHRGGKKIGRENKMTPIERLRGRSSSDEDNGDEKL